MSVPSVLTRFGVRQDNFIPSTVPYLLVTILILMFMYGYSRVIPNIPELVILWRHLYPLTWVIIPTSILQELFFRGYLMPELRKTYRSAVSIIFINTLLFTFTHIFLPFPQIILPGVFVIGFLLATVYYYYPNMILISLAHIVVNYAVVPYCLFQVFRC